METTEHRSQVMRSIRDRNTMPELAVRQLLFRIGLRYRLHRKDLPGKPDIVFPGRRKVIFVNGCFWHGHRCKRGKRVPATNRDYWLAKIAANRRRDRRNRRALSGLGWRFATVWECELRDPRRLVRELRNFLK